jgi:hypothetical protein
VRALPVLAIALLAPPAHAWDSRCDAMCVAEGGEGTATARHRMTDEVNHLDEHRRIWQETLALGGAPPDAEYTLNTYVTGDSYQPVSFLSADKIVPRVHAPSEFAQLPDFSYSLWDWALGNETCPLGNPVLASACHSFLGHMGATNSNHFLPQTRTTYGRYHALAMDRARACGEVRMKVAGRPELQRFVTACVHEALTLEAIGHHFLQDSWSSGHMWQRWGSPDESELPDPASAGAVAALSGLIHGGRAVLQDRLPEGSDANDAMCAPNPDVIFSSPAGLAPGVGDMYLPQLRNASTGMYATEYAGMFNCAVGSVRAVLAAAGETLVAPAAGISPVDPSADPGCFAARSTNKALATGYAVDFKLPGGAQQSLPLEQLATGVVLVSGLTSPQLTFDILLNGAKLRLRAAAAPDATDMADGGFEPMASIFPNGHYDHVGAYIDPPLPWPAHPETPDPHELALLRQFHEAHASEWCGLFKAGAPELDLEKLRDRAHAATGAARGVACEICTELVERHLRIGEEATYDPAASPGPLCELVAAHPDAVQYVYMPAQRGATVPRRQLAHSYCGCDPLEAAAGTFHHEVTGAFQTALLVRLRTTADAVPAVDVPFTLEGPAGWNGGQPAPLTYPRGLQRQFFAVAATPVSGRYTVRATIDGQPQEAHNMVDATVILPAAQMITPDLTVANQIGGTWTAAAGAASYVMRVFDTNAARILTPTVFTAATSATLTGVPVDGSHTNALQVWAFSNDMQPADPPVPAQFDLSFNRVLLTGAVTVGGGGTVAPGSINQVSATVTGLAGAAVTWRATGGSLMTTDTSATWTAPMESGTYNVTATSVSNPAFHASAVFHVSGGTACDPSQVARKFSGDWRVISAYQIAFGANPNDCSKIGVISDFMGGGLLVLDSNGTGTVVGANPIAGSYACGVGGVPVYRAGGGETSLGFGSEASPDDQDTITGQTTIRVGKYLPCVIGIMAARTR